MQIRATRVITCAACGAEEAHKLYEVNQLPIVRCACGLARTELPADFDPASIYTAEYFQGGHSDGYADYQGSAEALKDEFRHTLAALPVKTGTLLEIGCAYGYFLDEASKQFEVTGVEISDDAREQARSRGHVVARELDDEVLARGPFDAAVMLDVIEHLPDPAAVLQRVAQHVRPGGALVITTGDFGSLLARTMGKRWRLMTPPQHLWFFSPKTIEPLLVRCGFRVASVAHPWKRVPAQLLAYQAARYVRAQSLVRRLKLPGRVPVNFFDAMRVIATKQ